MTIDQLVIYIEKIRSVSVSEAVHYLLGEIGRFMDENARLTAELAEAREDLVVNRECYYLSILEQTKAELEEAKALVCSTTIQRNEYFVRAEQAERLYTMASVECAEYKVERDRYREALEHIANKGSISIVGCKQVAREALKNGGNNADS